MGDGHAMIEFRRLHRFFGATRAIDDVSSDVGKGQVFGFIGLMAPGRRRACEFSPPSTCRPPATR